MSKLTDEDLARRLATLAADVPAGGLLERLVSRWTTVEGPLGPLYVAFTVVGIRYSRLPAAVGGDSEGFRASYRSRFGRPVLPADAPPADLIRALRTGRTRDLTYDLHGLSSFEQDVLAATGTIPAGETRPYGWVAAEIGRPRAVRAVGSALGRNPVPILIPCHRVTRSDGQVGDYVFGSAVKRALLVAENPDLRAPRPARR